MTFIIDIQRHDILIDEISDAELISWATAALKAHKPTAEITLRISDCSEVQELNNRYRGKDKPTNVLSFPYKLPDSIAIDVPFLGDIILCPTVLIKEAKEQGKSLEAHCAHLVIHGVLHLLGYDHIQPDEASMMETEEIKLLSTLGYDNPYEVSV